MHASQQKVITDLNLLCWLQLWTEGPRYNDILFPCHIQSLILVTYHSEKNHNKSIILLIWTLCNSGNDINYAIT